MAENQEALAAEQSQRPYTTGSARQEIERIDREIDAVRRELMNRLHVDPGVSAHIWQNAWDRCPDLRAREDELFRQRGNAQVRSDNEDHKAALAEQRRERAQVRKDSRTALENWKAENLRNQVETARAFVAKYDAQQMGEAS